MNTTIVAVLALAGGPGAMQPEMLLSDFAATDARFLPPVATSAPVPPTLSCTAEGTTATVSWKADAEAPHGPGRFTLTFTHGKEREVEEVSPFVPVFDPTSDLVRYHSAWASKNFKTTLQLFDRLGKTFGDFESPDHQATDLLCENHLPIRGATIVFAASDWVDVTTDLDRITGLRYCRDDASEKERKITLPVQFGCNEDPTKMSERLSKLSRLRSVTLVRVDGTAVPASTKTAKE